MTTLQRPHAPTLSAVLAALQQHERLDTPPLHSYMEADAIQKEAAEDAAYVVPQRLALATEVRIRRNGVEGVICAYSSCDSQRYEICYFDRHFWAVRRLWQDRCQFDVFNASA